MSLALNKPKLDNLAGDIWKSAECLSNPPFDVKDYLQVRQEKRGSVSTSLR